jgi:hypothetical protein
MKKSFSKIRHIQNSNLLLERRFLMEQTEVKNTKSSLMDLKSLNLPKNTTYIFIPQDDDYVYKIKGANVILNFTDLSNIFTNESYFNKFRILDKNSLQSYKLIPNYNPKSLDEISDEYPILLLEIANPKDGNKYPIIYVSSVDGTVKNGDLEMAGDISQK